VCRQILVLVEEICLALPDQFKTHLPELIPKMLNILLTDKDKREPTIRSACAEEAACLIIFACFSQGAARDPDVREQGCAGRLPLCHPALAGEDLETKLVH
jgi:hypothetical protein